MYSADGTQNSEGERWTAAEGGYKRQADSRETFGVVPASNSKRVTIPTFAPAPRIALARHRMVGSMGRVGSSGDNAAMESFFALLQKNVLDRRSWITREQLRIAIVTWIERTYHRRRRQQRLGRLTPIEFETIMNTTAALAA